MPRHLISTAALAALLALAAGSGDAAERADKAATAKAEIPTVLVRQPFELDGVEFKVQEISKHPNVGRGRFTRFAPKEAKFVVVQYEVTNKTKEPISFLTLAPTASDAQGRTFTPDMEAQVAIARTNGNWKLGETLQPGVMEERVAVFKVPNDALPSIELAWKAGMLGKDKSRMFAGFGEQ